MFYLMKGDLQNTIWTIGHSTHDLDTFIAMLKAYQIEVLADVRNFPGSKRYPHFNKEELEISLPKQNIKYLHFKDLGGRRKPMEGSVNTAWKHKAFRGYADYMQTETFKNAASLLDKVARENNTAYMCSEAVWWSCHRSLISDYFKANGWKVLHIMSTSKATEHPYTSPAKIINGKLSYSNPQLF